jgi:uncharacterized protein YoaH (UPF0181 family)
MNPNQADGIENLMAQGFSRVQAIKIFYEQSLSKYYKKNQSDGASVFDQVEYMHFRLKFVYLLLFLDRFSKK